MKLSCDICSIIPESPAVVSHICQNRKPAYIFLCVSIHRDNRHVHLHTIMYITKAIHAEICKWITQKLRVYSSLPQSLMERSLTGCYSQKMLHATNLKDMTLQINVTLRPVNIFIQKEINLSLSVIRLFSLTIQSQNILSNNWIHIYIHTYIQYKIFSVKIQTHYSTVQSTVQGSGLCCGQSRCED